MTSIRHHDTQIARSVGAFWMTDDPGGAIADAQELFIKGSRFLGEIVRDCINKWAIPELVRYNWPTVDEFPELRVRRIGDTTDWRQISFAMRNFVGAGLLTPDEPLERWIRDEMDLPAMDKTTQRKVATPQQAAKGKPQQSTAGNMQIGTGSNGRVGRDGQGAS
jgi:hypothetical protein